MELWKPFASLLGKNRESILLQEKLAGNNGSRFSYISQHVCSPTDFNFAFVKGKRSTHLPENKASLKQVGGYLPIQIQSFHNKTKASTRILAFVAHGETELAFYQQQNMEHLNIYEAYFENCAYGHVMEYFLQPGEAPRLLTELNNRTGVEAALYLECLCLAFMPGAI
jgi:hypothetical protein